MDAGTSLPEETEKSPVVCKSQRKPERAEGLEMATRSRKISTLPWKGIVGDKRPNIIRKSKERSLNEAYRKRETKNTEGKF